MSRMKWNLDLLEEVKKQHDEALISTEHVVNKVRSDLYSMTEEVWEGEDADIARDQLHELSFKEMPDTYDQIDTCNNVIQKAQKEAYESKNFCNDFPQIFSNGSMPSDGNQSRCTGDLMRDEDSCEGLKSSMKAAGENARNVHSAISSVESILASLETDFAKFDYSSYTQPIKDQTQKVAERTEMYNTAVTRYEQKTKELDHTLSNALKLATPDFVPAPLDPSCLGIGDERHFGDSKITGFLEEYITAKIEGELDEAQIKDILSMLFDKENVDISEYSEEDFGMAFIKLSEEKKRAMLMEMGYNKEQIDSILDSCKGNKAVTVGNSIGRTLIEKIADKDGNKYGRLGETGIASTLGLAGIRKPGQFNNNFVKTSVTGNDPYISECKADDEEDSTDENSKYEEYMSEDEAVNAEIVNLFETYGDDLSGLDGYSWEDVTGGDVTKEKALAHIYDVGCDFIEGHLSNEKCALYEEQVGNILDTCLTRLEPESGGYIFYPDFINDLSSYTNSEAGTQYIEELKTKYVTDYDCTGRFDVDVKIDGVGIIFSLSCDGDDPVEINCHTTEKRIRACMDYWEKQDPGCYTYTRSIMSDEQIIEMYNSAETSGDVELIDNLMKSDSKYEEVFSVDSDRISTAGSMVLGQYGNNLLMLANDKGGAYEIYYNNFLSQIVTPYQEGELTASSPNIKDNGYAEKYALGSSLVTDSYLTVAWATESSDNDEELAKQINTAKENELIAFSLYGYATQANENVIGVEVKLEEVDGELELHIRDVNRIACYQRKDNPTNSGLSNYGGDYLTTYYDIAKASEDNIVQMTSCGGLQAVDIIAGDVIKELNNKKVDLTKEVAVDTAIGIVGIFCEPAEKVLTTMKAISESDGATVVDQAVDITDSESEFGKKLRVGSTLYSAISDFSSKLEDINAEIEDLEDLRGVANFYTANSYNFIGGDDNYYVKLDDLNMIRLVQNWNEDGISVLYNDDVEDNLGDNYEEMVGTLVKEENSKVDEWYEKGINWISGNNINHYYSEEEIRKALNTLIYGCNSGKDSYESITEIPADLFAICEEQINRKTEDMACIEDKIQSMRSDYVEP